MRSCDRTASPGPDTSHIEQHIGASSAQSRFNTDFSAVLTMVVEDVEKGIEDGGTSLGVMMASVSCSPIRNCHERTGYLPEGTTCGSTSFQPPIAHLLKENFPDSDARNADFGSTVTRPTKWRVMEGTR